MANETEIRPALTPEEWERETKADPTRGDTAAFLVRDGRAVYFIVRSHDTWRGEPYTGAMHVSPAQSFAIMALANAALPEDDPRKITRELLTVMRACIDRMDAHAELTDEWLRVFQRHFAQLEALLPPEGH